MVEKQAIGVFDLGASGGRFFLMYPQHDSMAFDEVYRFAHNYQTFFHTDLSGRQLPSRFCWDFGRIYAGMLEGLKRLSSVEGISLVSFGIDTWGSDGTWVTDKGDMLSLVATGRDPRWQHARNEILAQISEQELFAITGIQSHPFNVLNQVYWYRKYEPAIFEAASQYMPVHSLLYYYLTGKRIAEYTWLSTTQLCLAGEKEYAESIFERLCLDRAKMPEILSPGQQLGLCSNELADSLEIKPFEVILPTVHDTACSYAVANCEIDSATMVISTGTWFLAGAKLSKPLKNEKALEYGFSNEGGYDCVRFLKNIMGSWPMQQLRRLWGQRDGQEMAWSSFEQLALEGKPFNCSLDVDHPLFFSADNMETAVHKYCTLTSQPVPDNRADMARTVYEGIAMKVAITAELLGTIRDIPTQEILIVGGIAKSTILNQWFADASCLPVRVGLSDATACGNGLIQAVSIGWTESISEARDLFQDTEKEKILEPENSELWNKQLKRLKEMMNDQKI